MASTFAHRKSVLAVDLTSASAPTAWQRERDPETASFIQSRLAGLAKLLDRAGADLLTVGGEFRLGGKRRRDEHLDGALALSRLGQHTSSVLLAASIPLGEADARTVAGAVASIHRSTGERGGWQVDAPTPEPARDVQTAVNALRTVPGSTPTVVVNVRTDVDVEIAAARADVARLRVTTVEEARNLRGAIRAAATDWGRNPDAITVLVDVHAILADDAQDAEARALFIEELEPEQAQGLLRHVGTVTALANVWQNWVRAGAADGFTILPASIPTDIVHISTGLLPELHARGLRTEVPATAPTTTATRTAKHAVGV